MARYTAKGLEKILKGNEERFVLDAKVKFGDYFDYSKVSFKRQKIPVTILCPKHGTFRQTPDKHLQSKTGCPKCGIDLRSKKKRDDSRKKFLAAFNAKYSDKIELLSDYAKATAPIKCRCKIHKFEFSSTPDRLSQWKHGCPQCAKESTYQSLTMPQDEFIRRAHEKFGEQFDLSNAIYSGVFNKLKVNCPVHGQFTVTPVSFLQSTHGCPNCASLYSGSSEIRIQRIKMGIVKPRPTTVTVIKVEVFNIAAYKVGITSKSILHRYRHALREILFEATLDEIDALQLERAIHIKYFRYRDNRVLSAGMKEKKRWSGDTEIYQQFCIPDIISFSKKTIEAIERGEKDYWKRNDHFLPPRYEPRKVRMIPGAYNMPKPVIRRDTLETYLSATAAAKAIGSTQGNVSLACLGKREHAKGIRFAYLDDYKKGSLATFQQRRKGKHNPRAKAVRCIETGKVFDTISGAAKEVGVHSGKIVAVCKGKRKSAGGYGWEYVD
jgi:hypothetical protein